MPHSDPSQHQIYEELYFRKDKGPVPFACVCSCGKGCRGFSQNNAREAWYTHFKRSTGIVAFTIEEALAQFNSIGMLGEAKEVSKLDMNSSYGKSAGDRDGPFHDEGSEPMTETVDAQYREVPPTEPANGPARGFSLGQQAEEATGEFDDSFDMETMLNAEQEGWRPEVGDILIGDVLNMELAGHHSRWGTYPLLTIRQLDEAGTITLWHAFHQVTRNELENKGVRIGDRIGVKYLGKEAVKGNDELEYDNYRILKQPRKPGKALVSR